MSEGMVTHLTHAASELQNTLLAAASGEFVGGSVHSLRRDDCVKTDQGVVWFPLDAVVRGEDSSGLLQGWTDHRGAIGLSELLGDSENDSVWITEKAGRALAMPAGMVEALLARSPGFQRGVIAWLAQGEHAARRRATHNLAASASDRVRRVVQFVLSIHDDDAPLTQGQLAAYVGIQRTTVCAIMQEMQAEGQIIYSRGRIRRREGFQPLERERGGRALSPDGPV